MTSSASLLVESLRSQVRVVPSARRLGRVSGVSGLIIESGGRNVGLGVMCLIRSERGEFSVVAVVVGFRSGEVLLLPVGGVTGLKAGCDVVGMERPPLARVGRA